MSKWLDNDVLTKCILIMLGCIVVSWVLYGLLGYRLIKAMYQSESVPVVSRFMAGRSSTPVENYLAAADGLMIASTFWSLGLVIFLTLARKNPWMPLYVFGSVFVLGFMTVACIEIHPPLADLLHLDGVDYYAYRKLFTSDAQLGYKTKPFLHARIQESVDPREYGVEAPRIASDWTTDKAGFRNDSASQSPDVVIVGDGMINSGLSWEDTFSRRLERHLRGWSVENLGVSGHGPFQYLRVFQTYGIGRKPKYAIFSFNEGNDIGDIGKYLEWKAGSSTVFTNGYESGITAPLLRFRTAYSQTLKYLKHESWLLAETVLLKTLGHDAYFRSLANRLALVRLPTNRTFRIAFIDLQNTQSSDEIRRTENWKQLKRILVEFESLCGDRGITPVVMFIPTAAHIYAEYSTKESGANWLSIRNQQIRSKATLEKAVTRLSGALGITFVSLTPAFEAAARSGLQLFDSFSVHMNSQGTEIAGGYIARWLQSQTITNPVRPQNPGQTVQSRARTYSVNSLRSR
jgi:hypothetical protein